MKEQSNMNVAEILKKKGIKATRQRICVFKMLSDINLPVTAEALYLKSKEEKYKTGSISTVYRTLELFVEHRIVVKVTLKDTHKAVYEISGEIHKHHLICLDCKKIMVIEGCPLAEYQKSLEQKTGYSIAEHRFDLYGYCPECKEKTNQFNSNEKTSKE